MPNVSSRLFIAIALFAGACASPSPAPVEDQPPVSRIRWEVIAFTPDAREILAATIGDGPRRVYIIAGIHGDEPEGRRSLDKILDDLDVPGVVLRVVRDMNPDGSAAGTRENANGVDLNRNWPATNYERGPDRGGRALSESETFAVHRDLMNFGPELVLVMHASDRGPFVNYDGPARRFAESFAEGTKRAGQPWEIIEHMGYPTPGSVGSWAGRDHSLPILTLEFMRDEEDGASAPALREGIAWVLGRLRGSRRIPPPSVELHDRS